MLFMGVAGEGKCAESMLAHEADFEKNHGIGHLTDPYLDHLSCRRSGDRDH